MDDVVYQAPLPMGFSRQEYWSELSSHSPGDLPNPGIEPGSPALQADSSPSEPPGKSIGLCIYTVIVNMIILYTIYKYESPIHHRTL